MTRKKGAFQKRKDVAAEREEARINAERLAGERAEAEKAAASLPDAFPLLTVWGDRDNLASIDGPVGLYFRDRARRLEATRFEEISAGHVPPDDAPAATNRILAEWLATVGARRT